MATRNKAAKPDPATQPNKGGRPRVHATPVMVRMTPAQLERLDQWIAAGDGVPLGRPEAVRRLVDLGLEVAASRPSLAQQIAKQQQKLARKIPVQVGPERGHAIMRKGLAEVEYRKLVAAQKTSGRKPAGEPDAARRPAQATGQKGSEAAEGTLTRRAMAARVERAKPAPKKPAP